MQNRNLVLAVGLMATFWVGTSSGAFIIDDFNTTTTFSAIDTTTGDSAVSTNASAITAGNTVLGVAGGPMGAQRYIFATLQTGSSFTTEICATCKVAHSTADGSSTGISEFQYALGGATLDLSGYNTFEFGYAADLAGATVRITLQDTNVGYAEAVTTALPATGGLWANISLPLVAGFSFDPGDVWFIVLNINPGNVQGMDFSIDDIRLTSVPEPTTLALVGLGLAGLGAIRRRKLAA